MPHLSGKPLCHVSIWQVLVLVHSMRVRPGATSYAGLLLERGRRGPPAGARRSAAALLGRLLLALIFVYAGYVQLRRIALRDWALTSAHRCAVCDMHMQLGAGSRSPLADSRLGHGGADLQFYWGAGHGVQGLWKSTTTFTCNSFSRVPIPNACLPVNSITCPILYVCM